MKVIHLTDYNLGDVGAKKVEAQTHLVHIASKALAPQAHRRGSLLSYSVSAADSEDHFHPQRRRGRASVSCQRGSFSTLSTPSVILSYLLLKRPQTCSDSVRRLCIEYGVPAIFYEHTGPQFSLALQNPATLPVCVFYLLHRHRRLIKIKQVLYRSIIIKED